ncbi:histone H3-5-like [Armigeres subalbatus]|uniref:histone H3-5-like n=1 Tax=Armigeres subalbatus TaxID=124917 RepID=UPI002ED5DF1E
MPRRSRVPPSRNPHGLGAHERSDESSSDISTVAVSPQNVHRSRRRSVSENRTSSTRSSARPQPRQRSVSTRVTNALAEIHRLQQSTCLLIPKLPFARLIREIMMQYTGRNLRITREALMAIQEAAEIYLVMLFEDTQKLALHRQRVTITKKDMDMALYFRIS